MGTLNEILDTKWTVEDLKLLLERDSSSINEIDAKGYAPLHRLLINKDKCTPEIIRLLIQYGVNVNLKERAGLGACTNNEGSPLIIALINRVDKTIIKELLKADIDIKESVICTALYYGNSTEVFRMLVDSGFPLKCRSFHPTIFHCALEPQHWTLDEGLMKMLLDNYKDVNLNILNDYQQSLLCLALNRCRGAAIAKMLIDAGCLTNICERHPSLWVCATSYSSKLTSDVVELVAKITEDDKVLEYTNKWGENLVMMALKYGEYELEAISLMLHYLPKHVWSARSYSGDTILHAAVSYRYANPAVISMLIKNGAEVNAVNNFSDTPLHAAMAFEDYQPDIIKALILNKALVNARNTDSQTPLMIGFFRGLKSKALQMLFYAGARTNDQVPWSSSSLLNEAVRECGKEDADNFKCLKLFLKYALLDNPETDIQSLRLGSRCLWARDVLNDFAYECRAEIHKMSHVQICPNLTLLQCLQKPFQIYHMLPYYILEPHDVDKMCDILCGNNIHVYLDDVAARIGRSSLMSAYLRHVYTVVPQGKGVKTVTLNYESILHLVKFLTDELDILRLSLAFHRR